MTVDAIQKNVLWGIGVALLACAQVVFAQVPLENDGVPHGGVQISPLRFEAQLRGGEEYRGTLRLKNFDTEPQRVTLEAENFIVTEDTENISFYPSNRASHRSVPEVSEWVTFSSSQVVLQPGEAREVPFTVRVPLEAPTGGYYGALFATISAPPSDGETSRIAINTRMGALLILAVHGKEPARVEGAMELTPRRTVEFSAPAQFFVRIINSGNLHFRGAGHVTISRAGTTVATLPLASHVNYPGKVRTYTVPWKFRLWHAGPYTVTAQYESLSGLVDLEQSVVVWILPWTLFALIGGLFILLLFVVRYIRTHYTITRRDSQ